MTRAIVFDFDGVILDSVNVKTNAFAKMFEDYGDAIKAKVVAHHLANGGISRFEKFKHYYKEFLGIELSEEQLKQLGEKFSELVYREVVNAPAIPGAVEFLEKQKLHTANYVASGTPEEEIIKIIEEKKLAKYFKKVYGSPKTKKEIIEEILNENNYERSDLVFIGDALTDYNAARNAGVNFIGIKSNAIQFPDEVQSFNNFYEVEKAWQLIE